MKIAIASGKGGTGKTTIAVNLAYTIALSGKRVTLLDCDVEEPNDHLFIQPDIIKTQPVQVLKPVLEIKKCNGCGKCAAACTYNAVIVIKDKALFFPELCHACSFCAYICPEQAIKEEPHTVGSVQSGTSKNNLPEAPFFFAWGLLNIGEAVSPAVIRKVKQCIDPKGITLIDASPGTGCPVVEAINNTDVTILVTEPTPFGLNDLKLAVNLCLKLNIPVGIIVNRSDGRDRIIAEYAEKAGVPIIGRIPFSRAYAESYSRGEILARTFPALQKRLVRIFASLEPLMRSVPPPAPVLDFPSYPDGTLPLSEKGSATSHKEIGVIGGKGGTGKTSESAPKEIGIISGKGGTGKTTVVASLAFLARSKVLVDTDVDAADLHLLLDPSLIERHEFIGGKQYKIDPAKCTACAKCAEACHFDAVHPDHPQTDTHRAVYKIDPFACEGCGFCAYVCPEKAVTSSDNITGRWFVSRTPYGPLVHARLGIGEENSGKLVTQVRKKAAELAAEFRLDTLLSDGPPGTGCPVIASVSGIDMAIIVTEPTVSGVHDLERILQLCNHFDVASYVVINKADLNLDQAQIIEEIAEAAGSRVMGKIPFDRTVEYALRRGEIIVEYGKGPAAKAILALWDVLKSEMETNHSRSISKKTTSSTCRSKG